MNADLIKLFNRMVKFYFGADHSVNIVRTEGKEFYCWFVADGRIIELKFSDLDIWSLKIQLTNAIAKHNNFTLYQKITTGTAFRLFQSIMEDSKRKTQFQREDYIAKVLREFEIE